MRDISYTLLLSRELTPEEEEILAERFPDVVSGVSVGDAFVGGLGPLIPALNEAVAVTGFIAQTLGVTIRKFVAEPVADLEAVPA